MVERENERREPREKLMIDGPEYEKRRVDDRESEIPLFPLHHKYPLLPRTKAEWDEDMAVKVSVYGKAFRAVTDVVYHEEYGLMVVWLDGTSEGFGCGSDFAINMGWDYRLQYTQNREIIGVKPEYEGIAENWGFVPIEKKLADFSK